MTIDGVAMAGCPGCAGTPALIARSVNLFRYLMKDGRHLLPAKGVSTTPLDRDDPIDTYHCPHIPIEDGFDDHPQSHYDEYDPKQRKDNPENGLYSVWELHREMEQREICWKEGTSCERSGKPRPSYGKGHEEQAPNDPPDGVWLVDCCWSTKLVPADE